MPGRTVRIPSRDGGSFDCYVVMPAAGKLPTSAVVLASAVHGVDADIRLLADEFGAQGIIAVAPDLFWRSIPGPLIHGDRRAAERSQPRLECIRAGESDMADTFAYLRTLSAFNGNALAMGFCYGGPYAIIGPKRLGYSAGVSCHGSQMLDFARELEGVDKPVCVIWGDRDYLAPIEVVGAYRDLSAKMRNIETHIVFGAVHGFMMRSRPTAFHMEAFNLGMNRSLAMLRSLGAA